MLWRFLCFLCAILAIVSLADVLLGGESATVISGEPLWSLSPVADPTPPAAGHPIDAFLGNHHGPPTTRRALVRRVNYDLIGLPPSPEDVETFVADPRDDDAALSGLVETLLASPHYGEHWGRHWLDVVRYADTAGENSDHPLPHAWRYRNWVIDAFNRDQPYDDFVRDQLAGDLRPEPTPDSIVATGYLAIARRFGHNIDESMHLTYEDAIDNIGKAFLGLSLACARCHDHKHDPIPMRDYYALYGVLQSTRFAFPGCEPTQQPRDLVPIAVPEVQARRASWQKEKDAITAEIASLTAREAEIGRTLQEAVPMLVSHGDVPDAGSVTVNGNHPLRVKLQAGEVLQLSILPQGNHGADTTIIDWQIETDDGRAWSPADLMDTLLESNPQSGWGFLDTGGAFPRLLNEPNAAVEGKAALRSWHRGGVPSVLVNTATESVDVWTKLPPRTFFAHPGPAGPVAIAWTCPDDVAVTLRLTISDGHLGGDGVGWRLEHFQDKQIAARFAQLGNLAKQQIAAAERMRAHDASEPMMPVAYAVNDGAPTNARLHDRGDPEQLLDEVPRTFLTALGGGALGDANTSGRLDLANRIVEAGNPLSARVMVNRIWTWHFGRGLVATPNDFGTHGTAPTQPELLDWLASRFVESGWSIKAMHRLILSSPAYRQAAGDDLAAAKFAAFSRRRLTAEELRDTLLAVSSQLDRTPGAEHPFPPESSWNFTQHNPFADDYPNVRRSVYLMRKRNRADRFLALFDGADPNASVALRDLTTAPTQALYFMNDPFFHDCATKFAERMRAAATDTPGRLDFATRELFARPVTPDEIADFETFAKAMPGDELGIWNAWARVLLGSNELLYLD